MGQAPNADTAPATGRYEDFLLAEYNNIAQAHFNTINTISTFFRYYLLIVALPVPTVVLLFGAAGQGVAAKVGAGYELAVPLLATVVSLVGLCVMGYVAHLKMSATLYARTVNGVREYFTARSGLTPQEESKVRVLPRDVHRPPYREWGSFGFIVAAFALIDAAYSWAGWWWWLVTARHHEKAGVVALIAWCVVLIAAHGVIYELQVRRRQALYRTEDESETG